MCNGVRQYIGLSGGGDGGCVRMYGVGKKSEMTSTRFLRYVCAVCVCVVCAVDTKSKANIRV